jgi:ribosomal protein S18 acetylase RimI-like enzyme
MVKKGDNVVRIREALLADAKAIARVHVESWQSAYAGLIPTSVLSQMSWRSHADAWSGALRRRASRQAILVAERGGSEIIGFGSCGPARSTPLPHAGEVYTLYVTPEHQDLGIGRDLLNRLFDALVERGFNSAMVWVLADNPARFFYEAMGGRRIAERDETLWKTVLHQAAYGWTDLSAARSRGEVR